VGGRIEALEAQVVGDEDRRGVVRAGEGEPPRVHELLEDRRRVVLGRVDDGHSG
jgi:hypothetical protein